MSLKQVVQVSARAVLAVSLAVLAACASSTESNASRASGAPPFIPIERHNLELPEGMQPIFATFAGGDDEILFLNLPDRQMWLVRRDGSDLHCITCDLEGRPPGGVLFSNAFPDRQRIMMTPGVAAVVAGQDTHGYILECAPSLRDCASHRFMPIDMSASRGEFEIFQRRSWHLAPDGIHIGWMEVRADGTVMVVARLERHADRYVAADPRAVNAPGPTSPDDDNADRWENFTQLYELKSFTPDGRGIVAVALPGNNVDMLRIDLATGETTRLTAHPDWDEDGSLSPDQQLLVSYSWRARERLDAFAWIPPIRGFSGLMIGAAIAPYYVSTWDGFQCDLSPWLLPASGDAGGAWLGQPIDVYDAERSPGSHQVGYQYWSSDSTTLLLQERTRTRGTFGPNRIVMARLGREPTSPIAPVATAIGDWAPPAALYRGPHAEDRTALVRGRAGGEATITLRGKLGGGGASTMIVFDRFTDDGETFVSGTMSHAADVEGVGERRGWTLHSDVVVSGRHTGSLQMDMRIDNSVRPLPDMSGTISAVYDGRPAPPLPQLGPCYDRLPQPSPLRLEVRRIGGSAVANVTADVYGDIRPVMNAILRYGDYTVTTDARGQAQLPVSSGEAGEIVVSAGDTFVPARAMIPGR